MSPWIRPAALAALAALAVPGSVAAQSGAAPDPRRQAPIGVPPADLSIVKDDGVTRAIAGREVVYTLTVRNAGPGNVTGARVVDQLPAELLDVTWTCVPSGGASCGVGGGPVSAVGFGEVDQAVDLPSGGELLYTVRGVLALEAGELLANTATVAPPPPVSDPDPADNQSTDVDEVIRPFTFLKWVAGDLVPGGAIVYTLTVVNDTQTLQPDNPGPELVDRLPPELTLVDAAASSGSVSLDLPDNRVEWNGAIAPGGSVTLLIEALIETGTQGREVVNQGELHFSLVVDPSEDALGDDPTRDGLASGATNDGLALSQDPTTGGPTIFRVLSGELSIPGLEAWGLLALAVLLGLAAVAALGRG